MEFLNSSNMIIWASSSQRGAVRLRIGVQACSKPRRAAIISLTIFVWECYAPEIWRYSQWEILSLSIWVTGVMKRWQNCVAQEEIWFESQTNPIQHFPKFEAVSCGAGIEIPIKMKYEKQSGKIQLMVSPNLRHTVRHPPALKWFPDTLWRKKHQEARPKVNSDAWES